MGCRILVAEDNPTNRSLMEYLLKAFGHTVLSAADGLEALAVARRERPDVILMDLQMPNLNGYDAVRQLKQHPSLRLIPVVAGTAFAMVGDRDRILASGFDGYIPKPISPETFVDQVGAFLPQRDAPAPAAPAPAVEPAPPARGGNTTTLAVDDSPAACLAGPPERP
jgi:CheY-like chemotaxis protein